MVIRNIGFLMSLVGYSIVSIADDGLSFQGYVGLINTPSTATTEQETLQFQYSNQMQKTRGEYIEGHNYIVSFGLLPFLDVNGRIATDTNEDNLYYPENADQSRDLSVNIKSRMTFIPKDWFELALGVQDLGGETGHYDAKYVVASKKLFDQIDLSAGFGVSDNVLGRLDGGFAGIDWKPVKNLSLMIEHDAAELNAGVRYSYHGKVMDFPFRLDLLGQLYVGEQRTEQDYYYGIGLKIPLGNARYNRLQRDNAEWQNLPAQANISSASDDTSVVTVEIESIQDGAIEEIVQPDPKAVDSLTPAEQKRKTVESIQARLVALGFESVELGFDQKQLTVHYENNAFNQNELDGLGVVLGVSVVQGAAYFDSVQATLHNQSIPIVSVKVDSALYLQFLKQPCRMQYINCIPESNVRALMDVWYAADEPDVSSKIWLSKQQSHLFKPQIMFLPSINSAIATEYGVFDYSLALQTNIQLPLAKGTSISADWDSTPIVTENVQDGEAFSYMQHDAGLRNFFVNHTQKFLPNWMATLSAGKFKIDYAGVHGETVAWFDDNIHRFKYKFGCFKYEPGALAFPGVSDCFDADEYADVNNYSLLSYRYFNQAYNTSLEITGGRFWEQESGFTVSNKYYMGDVTVSLNYAQTDQKTIALALTLPLTPRKDYVGKYATVRGSEHWTYQVVSVIDQQFNYLSKGVGIIPNPTHNLERVYLNNDRLSVPYIKNNLYRMRDAFLQYGVE